MPRVEVREMRLEDLATVFALGERIFTAGRWPNLYRTWDEYEVVGFFQSDGETCFVATIDDELVGFALGTLIEKRRNPWIYGYVVWVGVAPDRGRSGIGSKLLHRLHERFIELGARIALVDTDAANEAAIRFFQREGFGQRQVHVYMSMNLTQLPAYARLRERHRSRNTPTTPTGRRRRPGGASFVPARGDVPPDPET